MNARQYTTEVRVFGSLEAWMLGGLAAHAPSRGGGFDRKDARLRGRACGLRRSLCGLRPLTAPYRPRLPRCPKALAWRGSFREDAGAPGRVGANAGHIRALPRRAPRLPWGDCQASCGAKAAGGRAKPGGGTPPPLSPGVSPPSFAHPRALAETKRRRPSLPGSAADASRLSR